MGLKILIYQEIVQRERKANERYVQYNVRWIFDASMNVHTRKKIVSLELKAVEKSRTHWSKAVFPSQGMQREGIISPVAEQMKSAQK